jgi:hypothetical protein
VQPEGRLLQLGGFGLVVVIQAGLANGHHAWVIELSQQPIERWRFTRLEVQRVDTHRTIHIGVALGEGFDISGVFGADADAQEMPYPALARGFKRSVKGPGMLGEVKAVKVAMGIYEHKKVRLKSR